MIRTVSVGLSGLAFFHLLTHALFRALLFMCAGGVIHSIGDSQGIHSIGDSQDIHSIGDSKDIYSIGDFQDISFIGGLSICTPFTSSCLGFLILLFAV
jgi:NADH:ubiquinone oxidoreductase subunit 5 (subunit L)/multisubunit Na+/H+ antiporter MnhA subunit